MWKAILLSKKSNNDVWGKYIIRYIKNGDDYIEEKYELENWYITLPVTLDTDLEELVKEFKLKTWEFTDKFMKENNLNFDDMYAYTCHQLCDWSWLADEEGSIVRKGVSTKDGKILCDNSVTLVKYAKILKDVEEDKR